MIELTEAALRHTARGRACGRHRSGRLLLDARRLAEPIDGTLVIQLSKDRCKRSRADQLIVEREGEPARVAFDPVVALAQGHDVPHALPGLPVRREHDEQER